MHVSNQRISILGAKPVYPSSLIKLIVIIWCINTERSSIMRYVVMIGCMIYVNMWTSPARVLKRLDTCSEVCATLTTRGRHVLGITPNVLPVNNNRVSRFKTIILIYFCCRIVLTLNAQAMWYEAWHKTSLQFANLITFFFFCFQISVSESSKWRNR